MYLEWVVLLPSAVGGSTFLDLPSVFDFHFSPFSRSRCQSLCLPLAVFESVAEAIVQATRLTSPEFDLTDISNVELTTHDGITLHPPQ